MLLCGGGGQTQVAHQIVCSAIGSRGGGDTAVHECLVSQLVLVAGSGGNLTLDGIDVVGISLLSSLGAGFLGGEVGGLYGGGSC